MLTLQLQHLPRASGRLACRPVLSTLHVPHFACQRCFFAALSCSSSITLSTIATAASTATGKPAARPPGRGATNADAAGTSLACAGKAMLPSRKASAEAIRSANWCRSTTSPGGTGTKAAAWSAAAGCKQSAAGRWLALECMAMAAQKPASSEQRPPLE